MSGTTRAWKKLACTGHEKAISRNKKISNRSRLRNHRVVWDLETKRSRSTVFIPFKILKISISLSFLHRDWSRTGGTPISRSPPSRKSNVAKGDRRSFRSYARPDRLVRWSSYRVLYGFLIRSKQESSSLNRFLLGRGSSGREFHSR